MYRPIVSAVIFACAALAPAGSVGAAVPAEVPAAALPLPTTPDDLTLFSINEFDSVVSAPALSASVPSQDWVRAWFKWGNAPNLRGQDDIVRLAHSHGALMGGGVTCSAIYRGENGISEQEFMDLATRNPSGELQQVSKSYYHGATANPAYRSYVLKWSEQQIDAGVDTLFMDEVSGVYSSLEGYDHYGLEAFRQYLMHRFVTGDHWTLTDERWKGQFGIDLSDVRQCPDHTIASFDYAAYLQENGLADKPAQGKNPLWPLWGDPNAITGDSFSALRNNDVWKYWTDQIRDYARQRHRQVWLAANGLNRWVDYQITGIWADFPRSPDGKLSCTGSSLSRWRSEYLRSRALMEGKDVPIMVFHDWGEGMPWEQIQPNERVAWLGAYAPEVFAAGLFFAYPVHGPFGSDASKDGTLETLQQQARFVAQVTPLLHHLEWQAPEIASYPGKAEIAVQAQPARKRVIVHVINRSYAGLDPVFQKAGKLRVALAVRPLSVRLYTAEETTSAVAEWAYDPAVTLPGRSQPGVLDVTVPDLRTWDVVEILLPRWNALPGGSTVRIPCVFSWYPLQQKRFIITGSASLTPDQPNAFLQGTLHPDLRSSPTFQVKIVRPGSFKIHVDSVSTAGARLVVRVDGRQVLAEPILDKDGKNDQDVQEINQVYSVPLEPGSHTIAVDNDGGDWLTMDWVEVDGV